MMPLFLLLACTDSPPTEVVPDTCPEEAQPRAELSQTDTWGIADGTPIAMGIPPQGGAPYSPFDLRIWGMPASADGYAIEMEATATGSGEVLGGAFYEQRFVCANVPPNEGSRVTSELHLRFFGFEPDEIDGEDVDVRIQIDSADGDRVVVEVAGPLDWSLGPMP